MGGLALDDRGNALTAQCPSCGGRQDAGLLCSDCCTQVEGALAAVPELLAQLDVAISRMARIGGGGKAGKGMARERSAINFGALQAKDDLIRVVTTWAHGVDGPWTPEVDEVVVVRAQAVPFVGPFHERCEHSSCMRMRSLRVDKAAPLEEQAVQRLRDNIDALRRHPQVADLVYRLGRAVKGAYRAIDRAQERIYLGTCMYEEDGATCHAEVWARAGAQRVTCTQCGITHDVRERRAGLLLHAAEQLCTIREASQWMGAVGSIPVTQDRIRGYVRRKRLAYRPGGNLIRLGDLLEIVTERNVRVPST